MNSPKSLASTSAFLETEVDKQAIKLKEMAQLEMRHLETKLLLFQQLMLLLTLYQILAKFQKINPLFNALMMSLAMSSTYSSMTTTLGPLRRTLYNSALMLLPHMMCAHKLQVPQLNASARTFTTSWTLKEMPRLFMPSLHLIKPTETNSTESVNNLELINSHWTNNNGLMHSPTALVTFHNNEYTG